MHQKQLSFLKFFIVILSQASLGLSLAVALLRCRNQGGTLLRRCLAALLFANFLYNRIGHISGLKVCVMRRPFHALSCPKVFPSYIDFPVGFAYA